MIDFKKVTNRLAEIYTYDDENFFVGYIVAYDFNFCLAKTVDENGCFNSYELIKNTIISDILIDTDYLATMEKFIESAKSLGVYDPLNLENNYAESLKDLEEHDLLTYILKNELKEKDLISITTKSSDFILFGYISFFEDDYFYLNSVDSISITKDGQIKIFKSDIENVEFKSLNLKVLNAILTD